MINLGHGIFLETSEEMKAYQAEWDDEDPCKHTNFDAYPLWLTDDSGSEPEGYHSVEECRKDLGKDFDHLNWNMTGFGDTK